MNIHCRLVSAGAVLRALHPFPHLISSHSLGGGEGALGSYRGGQGTLGCKAPQGCGW